MKISDLSTRALWQSYQQTSSSKAGGTGEGNDEFSLRNIYLIPLGFFNMP
jgi:hypothetical protein